LGLRLVLQLLEIACRVALLVVLMSAGVDKLVDPERMRRPLVQLGFAEKYTTLSARVLGTFEVLLGTCALFVPATVGAPLYGALFLAFAVVALRLLRRGSDCGCGGVLPGGSTVSSLLVPRVFMALTAQAMFLDTPRPSPQVALLLALLCLGGVTRVASARRQPRAMGDQSPPTPAAQLAVDGLSRRRALSALAVGLGVAFLGLPSDEARASACPPEGAPCTYLGLVQPGTVCAVECMFASYPYCCGPGLKCCPAGQQDPSQNACRLLGFPLSNTVCRASCSIAVIPYGTCGSGLSCCFLA